MLQNLFPNPVYRHEPADKALLLAQMREYVAGQLAEKGAVGGHSTRGGTQTPPHFFKTEAAPVAALKQEIFKVFQTYFPAFHEAMTLQKINAKANFNFEIWGWVTSYDEKGWNAPHIHPRSLISGVYWLETPPQVIENKAGDYAGWLGFEDPRASAQIWPLPGHVNHYFIPPLEGTMVLFPSYMSHFVPPFFGAGARTSIAFNLRHSVQVLS